MGFSLGSGALMSIAPWAGCDFANWTRVSGHPAVLLLWPQLLGLTTLSPGLAPHQAAPTAAQCQGEEKDFDKKQERKTREM